MKLFHKLFLTVLACVLVAMATLVVVSRITIDSGLERMVQRQDERQAALLVDRLEQYYERFGTWDALRDQRRFWGPVLRRREPGPRGQPPRHLPSALDERRGDRLYRRAYILDAGRELVAGQRTPGSPSDTLMPLTVSGQTVGWLGFAPAALPVRLPEELALVRGQNRALTIAAGITLVLAALAAWLLARGIARPVARIGQAVGRLAEGHFESRSDVSGSTEIRRLARDVNGLAAALDRNQRLRHEWMTEIAHELRTPVTVLRGELEAVRDGIRQADERTMNSLHEEVTHLAKLLDDLQELALSDAGALTYRFESLNFSELVEILVDEYRSQFGLRGLSLSMHVSPGLRLSGDPSRLRQLLHNLLGNSLRHTDAGGQVRVALAVAGEWVQLTIADSAPGVAPEDEQKLFERFFRSETGRRTNGSGLGLTISRRIVEAHGGRIEAGTSDLGGLEIRVSLPRNQERKDV